MTRIDFYILESTSADGLARLACRLVDKAWKQGLGTLINVDTDDQAQRLDDLLWTFRDVSFLPHARLNDNSSNKVAAWIGCNTEPAKELPVLINLSQKVPSFFSRFERVAELVDTEPARRDCGRDRFCFYRDRGYPLETHKLS